jgi:hypothetical protein
MGFRPRNWRSGITGIAVVFASTQMNTARRNTLPTSAPITQPLLHGNSFPPRLSPTSCTEIAVTSSREPVKSTLALISFHVGWSSMGFLTTSQPKNKAMAEMGTWTRKQQRHPIESAMVPPNDAPHIEPNPNMAFCSAWYIPRFRKGIISEFTMVALWMLARPGGLFGWVHTYP